MTTPALITVLRCCACIPLLLCSSIASHCRKVSNPETRLAPCRKQIDDTDQQLEQGHSETLTAYLTAMSRFHNCSFGNISSSSKYLE
jgi:hypothetical protein